jgi:hypothetical protein
MARAILAVNAGGAVAFSALHVVVAYALARPVNIYLVVLLALFVVAVVCWYLSKKVPRQALVFYYLAYWAAITFMVVHYAGTGPYEKLPSVLWWLLAGAFILGKVCNAHCTIIYLWFCTLTLLWSALLYDDPVDAATIYPFLVLAAGAGVYWRKRERRAEGQLDRIKTALRICNDAPQETRARGP